MWANSAPPPLARPAPSQGASATHNRDIPTEEVSVTAPGGGLMDRGVTAAGGAMTVNVMQKATEGGTCARILARSLDSGRGGNANRRNDSGGYNQQHCRDFSSAQFPATRGDNFSQGSSAVWPSSSNNQLAVQVAKIMRQGMSMARGSTAPPSEAGSYMTAASSATVPHSVHSQVQQ